MMQVVSSSQSIQLASFPDLSVVHRYGEANKTGCFDFQFLRQTPLFITSNPDHPIEYLKKNTTNDKGECGMRFLCDACVNNCVNSTFQTKSCSCAGSGPTLRTPWPVPTTTALILHWALAMATFRCITTRQWRRRANSIHPPQMTPSKHCRSIARTICWPVCTRAVLCKCLD